MAKFIKIKNHLINANKVYDFELCNNTIFVSYSDYEPDVYIKFSNEHEAKCAFANIHRLVNNTYTRTPQ